MHEVKPVLELKDLAYLLARKATDILEWLYRNPDALPSRVIISGTRKLRWRTSDVQTWLASLAKGDQHG